MWKGATELHISFNISLNQFQTAPCQIFPSLVPVKLPASQFLFQGNYDDGKENIFHLPRNHNMTIRFLAERVAIVIKSLQLLKRGFSERKSTPLIAYVTITWGAAARTAKVAIMVKRVNVIRQSRSSTIAANFQSFSVAADSSSSLSITIIHIIVVVNIIIIIINHWLILDLILSVIILISLSIKLSSRWIPGGNIEPGGSSGAGSVLGSLRKKVF